MQLKIYKETHPSLFVSFFLPGLVLFPNILGSYKLFKGSYFFSEINFWYKVLCYSASVYVFFYLYFNRMFLLMKLVVADFFSRVGTVFIDGSANVSRRTPA